VDEADEDPVLECPTCGEPREHQVLRAAESGWTVRCTKCKATRTLPAPPKVRLRAVPAILAEGATSRTVSIDVPMDEPVAPEDEFDFEGHRIRVTAVERPDGSRPDSVLGRDLKVLYAKVFDTVTLSYTLNEGETTRSLQEEVEPELPVHIGAVRWVNGTTLVVKTLKSDQNRTLHRGLLLARNIRRVFADAAPEGANPGDKIKVRRRGAGPWGSQGASNRDRRPRGTGSHRA
jgi:uncharacterized Zn finger protein